MNVAPFARRKLLLAALLFGLAIAPQTLQAYPSSRLGTRMVWDTARGYAVLFGGSTPPDSANIRYPLDDTWKWNGSRWVQLYPTVSPSARFGHNMVYDIANHRAFMFGGASREDLFNDTWAFADGEWTKIETANAPSIRRYHAMAYDVARNRIVLYGGTDILDASVWLADTWEFDGTNWLRVAQNGPALGNPMLEFDRKKGEMILVGQDEAKNGVMYRWTGSAWEKISPTNMPKCVGQGALVYMRHTNSVFLVGGVCANGSPSDDTYEWNGTDWRELGANPTQGFVTAFALTYDPIRMEMVLYGGDEFGARNDTYRFRDNAWKKVITGLLHPGPRSLYLFEQNPADGTGWLFGGFNDNVVYSDLWKYANGTWLKVNISNTPIACTYPTGAWDPVRSTLVVHCEAAGLYEFNGAAWKSFASLDEKPIASRFSRMVYDEKSKKMAFFGGFDGANYLRNLWFWNGTTWKEATRDGAPRGRALPMFFYDPNSKNLIVFGGIGRKSTEDKIQRYGDMFSFDGTKWTELKPSVLPSPRYGAFVEWDPIGKKIIMFGGKNDKEEYINEQWEWNGSNWAQRNPATRPSPRMNGSMMFDPTRQQLTLYGGYAGQYFSDLWVWDGTSWKLLEDAGGRRRLVDPHADPEAGDLAMPSEELDRTDDVVGRMRGTRNTN
ncbi:MAG: Kelch repeat-containing protein [Thermoanaerobaculia bacterium]